MVTVSVILPTYNRSSTLARSIDSVLDQTYDDFEIIVVDDASTDQTEEVISGYDSVQYIRHKKNRGASEARNTGIKSSDGDLVAFIDSDDEWHPRKLERQVSVFSRSSSKLGVVYTGYYKNYSDRYEIGNIPSKKGDIYKNQLMKDWVNPTSTVMVRAECFDAVGEFNSELSARQDYELWIRISRHYWFDYIKDPLVIMNTDGGERITDNVDSRMESHKRVLDSIRGDISKLDPKSKNKAFSLQYYTMGRYLQTHQNFDRAIEYFKKSLYHYPLNWKAVVGLCLSMSRTNMNNDNIIRVKNIVRKLLLRK